MKQYVFGTVLLTMAAGAAFAQSAVPSSSPDALALLKRVAQHYADAKSYRIKSVEEGAYSSEFRHSSEKKVLLAAETPGNRYHYEGHGAYGGALRVTDGKNVWVYQIDERKYTEKPFSIQESTAPRGLPYVEIVLQQARSLRPNLSEFAKQYQSATRLADEVLNSNGQTVDCYVVRVQTADLKRQQPGYSFEKTLWIDKAHETILKTFEHAHTYFISINIPLEEEITTTYSTELDRDMPGSFFTFTPPSEAKLVADFPDPSKNGGGPDLTGETAPSLKLKSADGKVVSLDSLRGKPVLLDLWATWCPPCLKGLAQLASLYGDAKDKGLVFISVDQDEDAQTATDFLAKKSYSWPNFHDGDGEISKSLGPSVIPRTILIDAQGKIVFDRLAYPEDELRSAIAALGPDYASLARKPQPSPCVASK